MPEDKTLGEIGRSVDRIENVVEKLAGQMQSLLGPISIRGEQIKQINAHLCATDAHIQELETRMTAVQVKAGFIAGLISASGIVINFVMGRHG